MLRIILVPRPEPNSGPHEILPRAGHVQFRTCPRLVPNDVTECVQTVCDNIIVSSESGFAFILRQNFIEAAVLMVLLTQNTILVKDTRALGTKME